MVEIKTLKEMITETWTMTRKMYEVIVSNVKHKDSKNDIQVKKEAKKMCHKSNGMDICRTMETEDILVMIYDAKKNNATKPEKFQDFFKNPGFNYRQLTDVAHERGYATQWVLDSQYKEYINNLKKSKELSKQ